MEANTSSQLQKDMVDHRGWKYSGVARYAPNACEFYIIDGTSASKVGGTFARLCNLSLFDATGDKVKVGAVVLTWLQQIPFAT